MLPWGHAGFGYVLYAAIGRLRRVGAPSGAAVVLLGLGTQLPDLVDKPLAWYARVLPHGRSFAHSLVTGVPTVLVPGTLLVRRRLGPEAALAFAVGYLSHLAGDGYRSVLRRDRADLRYVCWPWSPPPPEHRPPGVVRRLRAADTSSQHLVQYLLLGVGTALWLRDGAPGPSWLLGRLPDAVTGFHRT